MQIILISDWSHIRVSYFKDAWSYIRVSYFKVVTCVVIRGVVVFLCCVAVFVIKKLSDVLMFLLVEVE